MQMQTKSRGPTQAQRHAVRLFFLTAMILAESVAVMAAPHHDVAPDRASATVSLEGLDLTTPEGRQAANRRLSAAAKRLCGRFSDSRRVSDRETTADCFRETMGAANQRLSQAVTARGESEKVARNTP